MKNVEATGRIRIIKIPAGEAPLEIRKAWVGLVLPCHPYVGFSDNGPDRGVLSNAKESHGQSGFSVPQEQAIAILEESHPEAAAWWKAHHFPQSAPDDLFGFAEDEAEIVQGVSRRVLTPWEDVLGNPDR